MPSVLVTGSSGLVGSACVRHFAGLGWECVGIDGNQRRDFFGDAGDTTANMESLRNDILEFTHLQADIRDRDRMFWLVATILPSAVIHCAAQPSHDWAATNPVVDWEVNAGGTLNLLESCRRYCPAAPFVFLSTNKVYGDAPNEIPVREEASRWEYLAAADRHGVSEEMRVDRSRHSLFGASKLAADVLVQEYGRAYDMATACLRCGCLTGGAHAGVEQHGFLAHLARCVRDGLTYTVYGYKGKQVRDQLHAIDVAAACAAVVSKPAYGKGEVYNLGGGRDNSVSVLEAIGLLEDATGKTLDWRYVDRPRAGDHVCYYSDTRKFRDHYQQWRVTRTVADIVAELAGIKEQVPA